jgi:hypothetical protein
MLNRQISPSDSSILERTSKAMLDHIEISRLGGLTWWIPNKSKDGFGYLTKITFDDEGVIGMYSDGLCMWGEPAIETKLVVSEDGCTATRKPV